MASRNRRTFLADVGRGMLVASLGSTTAFDLGLSSARASETASDRNENRLTFGPLEPLVSLMQETPPDRLLPILVQQLKSGTDLKSLVTSAALANARAFGGQDYTGYHTFMALVPAYQMASELPTERQALPVLKVLYRNSSRIHEQDAHDHDTLHPVEPAGSIDPRTRKPEQGGEALQAAVRRVDWEGAEAQFAALTAHSTDEAFNDLQNAVQDETNVHRVVLAWRAWAMMQLSGEQYANTFLRQSVRYCVDSEENLRDRNRPRSDIRDLLPRLLDQYHLVGQPTGTRQGDDAWAEQLARTIFAGTREQAADAAAAALAEGMNPEGVGEAISMAANLLLLHDPGRLERNSTPIKPAGCVHGDSVGVHASDAANAWRNIARVSNQRNRVASLIVGAYHTAGQTQMTTPEPYPYAHLMQEIKVADASSLLRQTAEAINGQDQARACAIVQRYDELGHASRPLFDLLLKYAVSVDGALHAEKYYRTVNEEYATTRPAYRGRQLVALARVTASESAFPAAGYAEACDLLGVS